MVDKEFPLYPSLTEGGEEEAQRLMDVFRNKIKVIISEEVEKLTGELENIIPYIESDSWINFRNEMMDGFKNYDNRKIQAEYEFKDIRQQIYKDFRDDIIKDLDQDNLDKIKELEERIERVNDYHKRF